MRLAGDRDRRAHALELGGLLVEAHLVQDLTRLADRGRTRAGARTRFLHAADESEQTGGERVVAENRVVHVRRLLEQARQDPLELVDGMGGVRAVVLDGALRACAPTGPQLALGVSRAYEHDEALGRVG